LGTAKTSSGKTITSSQTIKSFPFIPKTFYIDVINTENGFCIKNEKQLEKVFEYYDEKNN
jgi:hypothetical protein